jgi:hypothetical protein
MLFGALTAAVITMGAGPAGASAAETLGDYAQSYAYGCGSGYQVIETDHTAVAAGTVTKLEWRSDSYGGSELAQVVRPLGGNLFKVIAQTTLVDSGPAGEVQSVTVSMPIAAGDMLGVNVVSGTFPCQWAGTSNDDVVAVTFIGPTTVGDVIDVGNARYSHYAHNLRATIDATGGKPCSAELQSYKDALTAREASFATYGAAKQAYENANAAYYANRTQANKDALAAAKAAVVAARADYDTKKAAAEEARQARATCLAAV